MTMRERMLAVVRGEAHDHVPFVQYSGLAAPDDEVRALLGADNVGVLGWTAVHRLEHPNCAFESEETEWNGRRGERKYLRTPAGTLTQECVFDPALGSAARRKHFIERIEDYRIFRAYLDDVEVVPDFAHFLSDDRALGDGGLPLVAVSRTPFQQMWIEWVSAEDFAVHYADRPDIVEDVLEELAEIERRIFDVVVRASREAAIPFVDFPDNVTAPMIGRERFRRWCAPLYGELADRLSDRKTPVFVHADGDLKHLLDLLLGSGIGGLDSLSPPPDNDTRPGDVLAYRSDVTMWVNFPSSVHLASEDEIEAKVRELLEDAGHSGRLQIQISENPPPGAWRKSFPAIVRAIRAFGRS